MGTHALLQSLCPKAGLSLCRPSEALFRIFLWEGCTFSFSALCVRPARRIVASSEGCPYSPPLPQRTKREERGEGQKGYVFLGSGEGLSGAVRGMSGIFGPVLRAGQRGVLRCCTAVTREDGAHTQAVSERLKSRRRKEERGSFGAEKACRQGSAERAVPLGRGRPVQASGHAGAAEEGEAPGLSQAVSCRAWEPLHDREGRLLGNRPSCEE